MSEVNEPHLEDLSTEELKDLLVQTAGVSREFITTQAASKGVSERYFCLFLLMPLGSTDARMSVNPDRA